MAYLSPRPEEKDSHRFYRHEDYQAFSSLREERTFLDSMYRLVRRLNLRWKRNLIEGYWRGSRAAKPGRILDVGCGTGEFLATMKKGGWEVEGLERDERASAWARSKWGIQIHGGEVEQLPSDRPRFDVITLWHVIEHLYNPLNVLRVLRERLSDEGLFLIATPNLAGVDSWVYRDHWIALDAPRHVSYFTPQSLREVLSRSGFAPIAKCQLPFDPFFNALMSERLLRDRGLGPVFPFWLLRSGLVGICALTGGSRLFSAQYGATLVYTSQKSAFPASVRVDFLGTFP
jgi:2-polyprenyl-3-methyl-5-hydroxy-6-metoxy-1,4-benzoquinol methylase